MQSSDYLRSVMDAFYGKSVTYKIIKQSEIDTSAFSAFYGQFMEKQPERVYELIIESAESYQILHVAQSDDTFKLLTGECQVTLEEVPVAQLIQYRFPEDAVRQWRVASLTEPALEEYKNKAFKTWEDQVKKPSCEAAFKRLLQAGPVSNVFDKHIFPTPPDLKNKYTVVDEKTGKLVDIPHSVAEIRVAEAKDGGCYRNIDATLVGAPRGEQATKEYFFRLIEELKQTYGEDYVNGLMGANNF